MRKRPKRIRLETGATKNGRALLADCNADQRAQDDSIYRRYNIVSDRGLDLAAERMTAHVGTLSGHTGKSMKREEVAERPN